MNDAITDALGWSLVHSTWQGLAVAMLYSLFLALTWRARPQWKYLAGCFALSVLLAAVGATFFLQLERPPLPVVAGGVEAAPSNEIAVIGSPEEPGRPTNIADVSAPGFEQASWHERVSQWLPGMVVVWIVGVLIFTVRLVVRWWAARRLC
ncbi:MAG: bla regulator protein BlaR1, partial [Verrucomicrobiales bacterium]